MGAVTDPGSARSTAWQAAFVLGIAFTRADDVTATAVLAAALGDRDQRAAVRRHVAGLASVDEGTRRRALALLAAVDDELAVSAGATGLPA